MEVPFALSIHKFVNSVGADVGFAAFLAVAIMVLLYFAQARETATLRQRLEEAHDRIGGLEARIGQLMHLQSSRPGPQPLAQPLTRTPAPVTPAPAPARPMGSAIASVRRIPSAVPAAVAAVPSDPVAGLPTAPVGMGAPALASATKLIPDPIGAGQAAPDDTMMVPGGAVAPANGGQKRAPAATAAAAAPPRKANGQGAPPPPRVQIRPDAGSGAGPVPRRTVAVGGTASGRAQSGRAGETTRFNLLDDDEPKRGGRFSLAGRVVPVIIGVLAVVVIVVGLVVITGNGNGTTSSPVNHGSGSGSSGSDGSSKSKKPGKPKITFTPASVTVAVLNGTDVGGLAADVGTALDGDGYKKGNITNAASQTENSTVVYYRKSQYETAAQHVAKSLKLSTKSVQQATSTVLNSCATTPTATTTKCTGDVIVSVGQDLAGMANGSSAG